ncbi:MAG: thioredoxin domain-containing protein [Actinomycetota bacterium]|nr:thioredoxin domain-containing protein [Actinomycetota bacterium]
MINRLAQETSPYLRQHQENPVDWFSWSSEAFSEAQRRGVPILLSIGYSACHWCHVMAHECFEDLETAKLMNQLFVNIKVDREERPDIDALYMDAVQAMSGRGGWPMTVFMSPDGHPFYGGTYFPKPSFIKLMNAVNDAWHNRRADIENNIAALGESLSRTAAVTPDETLPSFALVTRACDQLIDAFDHQWGGFGSAPKFPSTMNIDLLLRKYIDEPSETLKTVITTTLDAMASGGMYDHIGGGFSRYSVDEKWLVPHFEKMLYDQALLLRVYAHAATVFQSENYRQICEEIVEYVTRDLRDLDGGFFSAEDADSLDDLGHSHEGHFYVFTPSELRNILPENLVKLAFDHYEISDAGNFEGKNILTRLNHRGDFKRSPEIEEIRSKIFDARNKRKRPLLDDKILTEWNAMMAASLIETANLLGRKDWLEIAEQNCEFLFRELRVNDQRSELPKWARSWQRNGSPKARHRALACDLAHLVDAFTRLAEATGKSIWISRSIEVADQLFADYWDEKNGGLFTIATDAEQLVVRQKDLLDNATPSANSVAANALLRLGTLTGDDKFSRNAHEILRLFTRIAEAAPSAFGNLLHAVYLVHKGVTEIAITGDRPDLVESIKKLWLPTVVVAFGEPYESPLWQDRRPGFAYVCQNYVCNAPASTVEQLHEALATLS